MTDSLLYYTPQKCSHPHYSQLTLFLYIPPFCFTKTAAYLSYWNLTAMQRIYNSSQFTNTLSRPKPTPKFGFNIWEFLEEQSREIPNNTGHIEQIGRNMGSMG